MVGFVMLHGTVKHTEVVKVVDANSVYFGPVQR